MDSYAIGAAGGFVGVAGAVDVGGVKNDVAARILGGAQVSAVNDVEVNALGIKDLDGFVFSGAGGFVGLSGAVSVWSTGTTIEKGYSDNDGGNANAVQGDSGNADADAAQQAENTSGQVSTLLGGFQADSDPDSNQSRVDGATQGAATRLSSTAPGQAALLNTINSTAPVAGTEASIASGAVVEAGDDIRVTAYEDTEVDIVVGGVAGGFVGIGASVAVLSVAANTTAYAAGTLTAGDDIVISAILDDDIDVISLSGSGGFVGLGAAVVVVNDTSVVSAYIGNGADITSADMVTVTATDNRLFAGETGQISVGAVGAGASFVKINVGNDAVVETRAFIGDNVDIAQGVGSVNGVGILTDTDITAHARTTGIAAGIGAATANFAFVNLENEVEARIGNSTDIEVLNDIDIEANLSIDGHAEGIGISAGGFAVGLMLANVNVGRGNGVNENRAGVGNNGSIKARSLRIRAESAENLLAEGLAGSGGIVAGAGTVASVDNDNANLAFIGDGQQIDVETLGLISLHTLDFDASADAYTIALGSGAFATVDNLIITKANVDIGSGSSVIAESIVIDAINRIDKDRYKDSSSLRSGSAAVVNVSVLSSGTDFGTDTNPVEARVGVGSGTTLYVGGSNAHPGLIEIEALNEVTGYDVVRIESASVASSNALGLSRLDADTLAEIAVDGATIENKTGDIYLTTRTDTALRPSANLLVASGLIGSGAADVSTTNNATNHVRLNNATLKGADVYLYTGRDSIGVPNLLDSYAYAVITTFSLLPSIAVPVLDANINEYNTIDVEGTTRVQGTEDVVMLAQEGLGPEEGDRQRAVTEGMALSLSLIPYGMDVPDGSDVTSTNRINIGSQSTIEAGVNNQAYLHIKSLKVNGVNQIDPLRLGTELTTGEKAGLGLDASLRYEYAALDPSQMTFFVSQGTIIQVAPGHTAGGTVGHNYRYLPGTNSTSHSILLQDENFANTANWQDLGGSYTPDPEEAHYWSDVTQSFTSQLTNKLYAIKPLTLEMPVLSYVNVANLLLEQRQQILEWIKNHDGNAEAIARYQVQLDALDQTLVDLGLIGTEIDPGTGNPVTVVKRELDMLFVELPDIYASPGSIFIEADGVAPGTYSAMVGNQLLARAGAEIEIFNQTPLTMRTNDAIIKDNRRVVASGDELIVQEPGNVFVNNVALTAAGAGGAKVIDILQDAFPDSAYDLGSLIIPSVGQDIYVVGDVVNESGNVTIDNREGSINVSGEIRAENIIIKAKDDFNLNTEGWFHTNRDPRQYLDYDEQRSAVFNQDGLPAHTEFTNASNVVDPTPPPATDLEQSINVDEAYIAAQGRITVTARFLNINGLIQSGTDTIRLDIAANFNPGSQTVNFTDDDGNPLSGISFGPNPVEFPVDGYWDGQRQAIVLDEIVPQGGSITLAGQVFSTGNGRVRVANGYTNVDINNHSPHDLILDRIDVSNFREGKITIIDSATLEKTEYVQTGSQVVQTDFQGTLMPGDAVEVSYINYVQTGTTNYAVGANIEYQTQDGQRYIWTEGQEKTRTDIYKYEKKSFNLIGFDWDGLVADDSWKTHDIFFTDDQPLLESEALEMLGTSGVPSYVDANEVYAIGYEQRADADVDLVPGLTVVKWLAENGGDDLVYRYQGASGLEGVIASIDYASDPDWTLDGSIDPATFEQDPALRQYYSNFENITVKPENWTTGGGWL
ncbi:MAG: hypothetical protein GY724_09315, partial [Actinomycetia bacterium]|nr:hypothetical protein [Actinomycetes bacterium]